jgi:hypothetical protein
MYYPRVQKKFEKMAKATKPTGDGDMPALIRRAKNIKVLVERCALLVDFEH